MKKATVCKPKQWAGKAAKEHNQQVEMPRWLSEEILNGWNFQKGEAPQLIDKDEFRHESKETEVKQAVGAKETDSSATEYFFHVKCISNNIQEL